ncbi:hypothetical protein AAMO2058_000913400 [Amorphochlora amoebiformis]
MAALTKITAFGALCLVCIVLFRSYTPNIRRSAPAARLMKIHQFSAPRASLPLRRIVACAGSDEVMERKEAARTVVDVGTADEKWVMALTEEEARRQLDAICQALGFPSVPQDVTREELVATLMAARIQAVTRVSMSTFKPTELHPKGFPVVTVDIDGYGPSKFAVHTGANLNIVSQSLVDKINAEGGETTGISAEGLTQRSLVKLPGLSIGGRPMPDLLKNAVVTPIHEALLHAGVEGMLGTQFLESFDFDIRFPKLTAERKEVSNSASSQTPGLVDGGSLAMYPRGWAGEGLVDREGLAAVPCVPLIGNIPAALVQVGSNPKVTLPAIIDLGSTFSLMNNAATKALGIGAVDSGVSIGNSPLGILPINGNLPISPVEDAGGKGKLASLVNVMVGDAGVFNALQLTETPAGLLGLDVLGKERLVMSIGTQSQMVWVSEPN